MRCSSGGKIASMDEPDEPEVDDPGTIESGDQVDVRLVRNCSECGSEAMEATVSVTLDVEHDQGSGDDGDTDDCQAAEDCENESGYEVLNIEASPTSRQQTSGPKYRYTVRKGPDGKAVTQKKLVRLTRAVKAQEGEEVQTIRGKRYVERVVTLKDRSIAKDANGETIIEKWAYRYWRSFFGAEVQATVKCNRCHAEIEVSGTDETSASSFEDLGH